MTPLKRILLVTSFFSIKKKRSSIFYFLLLFVSLLAILVIICENGFYDTKKCFPKNVSCFNKNNSQKSFHKFNIIKNPKSTAKIHIAYVHYLNTRERPTIENFKFFMHFAHDPCHTDVDFTIILNLNTELYKQEGINIYDLDLFKNAFSSQAHLNRFKSCESKENPLRNTYLILRENRDGGDLCAFSDMIRNDFWLESKSMYTYFFFINSSARGPFVPNYWLKKW